MKLPRVCLIAVVHPVPVLALLTALLLVWPAVVVHADSYIVDRLDDVESASTCVTTVANDCSLRGAITAANLHLGADTIYLAPQTYNLTRLGQEDANLSGDLDILASGGDLMIYGSTMGNTIVNAPPLVAGTDRVFHVDPWHAGGVTVGFAYVTIQNGFTGADGGGIYNGGCTVNITDSVLMNNIAVVPSLGGGGAIYNAEGGTINLVDSRISGNEARGLYVGSKALGGGILNLGTVSISGDSVLASNWASMIAGAGSQADGGAIYNDLGALTIANSTIGSNDADNGGGIYNNEGSKAELIDCLIDVNDADDSGGGVYNYGSIMTITLTTFSSNEALTDGGGIANVDGRLEVSGSRFLQNEAGDDGGGIFDRNGTITIGESRIAGNDSAGDGGGIYSQDGQVTIVANTILTENSGHFGGGGIYNQSGTLTVTHGTISSNTTEFSGGGIYNAGETILTNCSLPGNEAEFYAGGFYNDGGATIVGSSFSGNQVSDYGGAIYNDSGTVAITDSTIAGNKATEGEGGGIYNNDVLTMTGCTLSGNSSGANGGGLFESGHGAHVTNSTLSANWAADFGGGVYSEHSTLYLENATITANYADNNADSVGDGGGVYSAEVGLVRVKNSIIAWNTDKTVESPDCGGTLMLAGDNLVRDTGGCTLGAPSHNSPGIDPRLAPLADNGGPTLTHALLEDSPAIDGVSDCTDASGVALTVDQRGITRPQRVACDIGAYEADSFRAYLPFVSRNHD